MPYYFTIKQPPIYEQMSLEDFLFAENPTIRVINPGITNTRTYCVDTISDRVRNTVDIGKMILRLSLFNATYKDLYESDKQSMYRTFYIPKKSGGFRRIDAPNERLMKALKELKDIFTDEFGALYHTAAYAYISGRSTLDCMKCHQRNKSKWFFKADAKGFFNNTTERFVLNQLSMVFPFCEIMKYPGGRNQLKRALSLAFLSGTLPQGTPLSPMLTNIMMIPIDHKLAGILRDYNHQRFVYTRYADDIQVSSKYAFSKDEMESLVRQVFAMFNTPFTLNNEKTRYGSSNGHNFNLGIMLNKDNQLTIGHKKKREFRAALDAYVKDKKNGIQWELGDVQVLDGQRAYYTMIEETQIKAMIDAMSKKYGVNIIKMIREDLRNVRDSARPKAVYVQCDEKQLVDDGHKGESSCCDCGNFYLSTADGYYRHCCKVYGCMDADQNKHCPDTCKYYVPNKSNQCPIINI